MKITPNPVRPPVDPAKLAEFAAGADLPEAGEGAVAPAAPAEPQVASQPSKKVIKMDLKSLDDKRRIPSFVMRFTAREQAMLKHIAETTPHSMHDFCLKAVRKALEHHFK